MLPYEGEEEEEEARNSHGGKEEEGDFQEAFGNLLVGRGRVSFWLHTSGGAAHPRSVIFPGCPRNLDAP